MNQFQLLCWRGDSKWVGRRATGLGWSRRSEGASRSELRWVPTLVQNQRRERLLGAATPGSILNHKSCSAGRGAKRLPAAPEDAAVCGGRIPWVPTMPQLPRGCSGMGQMSCFSRRRLGHARPGLCSEEQLLPPLCCLRRGLSLQK